jgi:hypothetical protein
MVPPPSWIYNILDVWAAAPDDVFAVGVTGTILRLTDLATVRWTSEESGGVGFNAVTGRGADDVVATSFDGRVYRYNGKAWSVALAPSTEPLLDVSLAARGTSLFILGEPHAIFLHSFAQGASVDAPYLGFFYTGWVTDRIAFVAGANGTIFEYRW